jgi:hypothetical protein
MWRRVPFLDLTEYIDFVREHRLPFVQENMVFAPTGITPESFLCIDHSQEYAPGTSEETKDDLDAYLMLGAIAEAVGIPFQQVLTAEDVYERLIAIAQRRSKALLAPT